MLPLFLQEIIRASVEMRLDFADGRLLLGFEREISRTVSFETNRGKAIRGTLHKVSRQRVIFEVYDPFLVLRTSEVLSNFVIRRGRDMPYQGDAIVTDVVNTSTLLIISASLVGDWTGLVIDSGPSVGVAAEALSFVTNWERLNKLKPAYRLRVGDLRSFLNDLRYWLDQVDLTREVGSSGMNTPPNFSENGFDELKQSIMPRLTELFMDLEEACRELDEAESDNHKLLAQRELLPLMMPSPFFNRVFSKPLGYAGDFEMVNMMFRNSRSGLTTYAQVVDDWLLAGGPPEAHRNRIYILENVLAEIVTAAGPMNRPIRILNVGCGPAQELQLFLAKNKNAHRIDIGLLDFNEETLTFAREQLTPLADRLDERPSITYSLKSVQDLLRQALERAAPPEPYDFIYCAGLFDYLSDRVSSKLVRLFFDWCKPGGRVLVTNVHSSNPVKGLMEHVMDWHLVLRNEADMLRFAPTSAQSKVYTDPTGINVFLDVYKPS